MKHSEIIAKMDDFNIGLSNGFGDVKTLVEFVNALRSVVELHKPVGLRGEDLCSTCWDEESYSILSNYPCETIQVIEQAFL
jgi:hypothetical protein